MTFNDHPGRLTLLPSATASRALQVTPGEPPSRTSFPSTSAVGKPNSMATADSTVTTGLVEMINAYLDDQSGRNRS